MGWLWGKFSLDFGSPSFCPSLINFKNIKQFKIYPLTIHYHSSLSHICYLMMTIEKLNIINRAARLMVIYMDIHGFQGDKVNNYRLLHKYINRAHPFACYDLWYTSFSLLCFPFLCIIMQ